MYDKNRIARLAANLPKQTKSTAFCAVENIIDDGMATVDNLSVLYNFFLPKITKIKTPFHWLTKARGKNDVRYYLNNVYSDGTHLFATDGHRAHIINEVRPAGWYDDNGQLIHDPDWANFPDVFQTIPNGDDGEGFILNLNSLEVTINNENLSFYSIPLTNMTMNKKYIDEAVSLDKDYVLEFFPPHKCKVTYKNGLAIVMGRRSDIGKDDE